MWRQYRYAYTADIEKMFRNIALHKDDQHLQCILWRDSPSDRVQEYQLTTVTYGMKAAPFLAMMVLKQLACDEGYKYTSSQAAAVLKNQFYMDDLVRGDHDIFKAKQLQRDLIDLLQAGGFNLRKWCSNTPELLHNVSTANLDNQIYDFKHNFTTKTFGLRWHPQTDELSFDLKINLSESIRLTKRTLLSEISKLFDPLGLLTPVTTKFKLLFQQVWSHSIEWDDDLPTEISSEWYKIRQDFRGITEIRIPRWLHIRENDIIQLHGFCDASINAYACVIYCIINKTDECSNLNNSVMLVAAKSRLVPTKKGVTLPRLELCATVLLSKLLQKVQKCLTDYSIKTFGWSDSTAVLGWLQGDPGRWKPFVANRVAQVTSVLPANSWRYVKSEENPADCASRGITTERLSQHPLWWHGPSWLSTFDGKQDERQVYTTDEEIRKSVQNNAITASCVLSDDVILTLVSRNSCWRRVTRIMAYVLRFMHNNKTSFLTATELKMARLRIIRHIQAIEFENDFISLRKHNKVDTKSKLLCLNPFIDKDGLLRVGGRLKNAFISKDMMHPLIIPHSSHLTNLLIDYAHIMTYHGGARVTSAKLRQQYWILGGNRVVKMRLRKCVTCRRHNPIKQDQLMGNLPECRINPSRPFYHTGVDFTGHVYIKSSKGRGIKTFKGYVALFICMVTKAIHLELVSDLTSSAFLAALRRMAARRGTPGHIYSDNGTNFVGANRILQQETLNLKNIISDQFLAEISEMEITWHFNAAMWPSCGGLWERGVRSLKYHLRRVIGEQKLTFEEYTTLLTQLEGCLNSRPLCALTEDPNDVNYLTPSHFLSSGPVLSIIETERDERTRWQLTQKIFGDIWKRWRAEYLTQLTSRTKWLQPKENIKVDDVVLIHDANLPPGRWALGRVTALHPGSDGYVRVVTLKTKGGVIKRPITKLSLLPVNENNQQRDVAINKPQRQSSKVTTHHKLCNIIITLLFIFTLCAQSVNCAYNISYFKTNQSLYFDKISSMQVIKDEWKMVIYYDMNPYWQGSKLLNKYITHLDNICSKQHQRTQCDVIMLQLRHGYSELHYYDQLLLSQHTGTSTRVRRGYFNGIGNIANTLFGVLDDNFAKQYQQDIDLVRTNQHHLANLWRNQTSVLEGQYNFLKRLDQSIDKQHKLFNQHIQTIEGQNLLLKKEVESVSEFTLSSVIANSILSSLKMIQNNLLDTVTDIYHGKFNIHIVSPDQLRNELSIISGHLSKDVILPIQDIHTNSNLLKIYHLLKTKVRVTDQYLLFEIKIPLVTRDTYDLYKIIPIPRMFEGEMVTIVPISESIAMNLQKDSYIPMSEREVQDCYHLDYTTKLCEVQGPIYHMQSELDLCMRDHKMKKCRTFTNFCHNHWKALNKLNNYLFYCCAQCAVRLMCSGQVTFERVSKAGVISIGSDCEVKGDSFMIYSHNHPNMNEIHIQPDIITIDIPPINDIINLTIPINLSENETDIKDRSRILQKLGQEIEQMKAKKGENDYISTHDVHQYAVTYILVAFCCGASLVFLWRRQRMARARRRAPGPTVVMAPHPAPRLSLIDLASESESASVPCAQSVESVSVPCDQPVISVSAPNVTAKPKIVSVLLKGQSDDKFDKATTPARVFPTFHANDIDHTT